MLRQTLSASLNKARIGIIGAPFNLGQPKSGVEEGPKHIRRTGFINELRKFGHDVTDLGDIYANSEEVQNRRLDVGPDGEKNHAKVLTYNKSLASVVENVVKEERIAITLGGDHSTAIGTISGHSQGLPGRQMCVLWIDAHSDLNTGRSSPSGNMHGMSVAYILRQLRDHVNLLSEDEWPKPCLSAKDIAYIGLRDIDKGEQNQLDKLEILNYGMREVDSIGIAEVIARCLDYLNLNLRKTLHLSFDVDSMDPLEAPSTGTPVAGGLTLREALLIGESAMETGYLRAMDVVEVNPNIGTAKDAERTAQSARSLILATLAGYRGA